MEFSSVNFIGLSRDSVKVSVQTLTPSQISAEISKENWYLKSRKCITTTNIHWSFVCEVGSTWSLEAVYGSINCLMSLTSCKTFFPTWPRWNTNEWGAFLYSSSCPVLCFVLMERMALVFRKTNEYIRYIQKEFISNWTRF